MGELFEPHVGLMVWTSVTFILLVAVLAKFGWGPLIQALDEREGRLRAEREGAEKARAEAQRIQADLEAKLAGIDAKAREVLAQAGRDAEALRAKHAAEAEAEAKRLLDKARAELEEEKRRLVAQLRQETAQLAVQAAESLVRKSIDAGVRKAALDEFFADLDRSAGGKR